ncbi:MAG: efflux RND transporter periplasmic adaptor subunit [Planctomycetota bacterium]
MELIRHIVACLALAEVSAAPQPTALTPAPTASPITASHPAADHFTRTDIDRRTSQATVRAILQPARRSLIAAGLDEPIAELLVAEGDRVEAGQPIARLDDRVARAMFASADARAKMTGPLAIAAAELEHATVRLERMKRAHSEGAASPSELQDAELAEERANAAYIAAKQNKALDRIHREELAVRLARHTIVAPFAGTVERVLTEAGESPGASEPVIELVRTARLRVELQLPAAYHGTIEPGDTVKLRAVAPVNDFVEATVAAVSPVMDSPTRTIRCIAYVDNIREPSPAGVAVVFDPKFSFANTADELAVVSE